MDKKIFIGPVIHSTNREHVTIISKAAIVVDNGKISEMINVTSDLELTSIRKRYSDSHILELGDGQFFIPGLIDTHTHAAQFPNAGLGYDKPLLDWLNTYTYPLESSYANTEFAEEMYKTAVASTLRCGTTTAVYFGTIHRSSCKILADIIHSAGQRALVGKVNMDTGCALDLQEETELSVKDTELFISDVRALKSSLVRPVITPRFALSCSSTLLSELGLQAIKHDLHIQTHLSESKEEVKVALTNFPEAHSYADVYDRAKLLTRKTILAHCVHLKDSEVQLLRDKGCSVAHCPNSNIYLQSGLCDVKRLLDAGVNVSLGTDVAGGCNPSILDAIRCALSTSITLSFSHEDYRPLTYHEAFSLATVGGAIALDMEDQLGNFAVGKFFDAVVVETTLSNSPFHVLPKLSLEELFQKFIYTGDDRNIYQVFVCGKEVLKQFKN